MSAAQADGSRGLPASTGAGHADDCVLFSDITTASGHVFGRATLNAPSSLNALSLAMVDRLAPRLAAWRADPRVAGVVLDATGDKAFCAGGDVLALYRAMRAAGPGIVPTEARAFFEREYRLDHAIHRFGKPLLCWGQGIVMGGGIGLLAGASHSVATPTTKLAMPEIGIGLYPDVGGSWFLGRMPGASGLFVALTGAPLNAADARFAGLADFVLRDADRQAVIEDISAAHWCGTPDADAAQLSHLLEQHERLAAAPGASAGPAAPTTASPPPESRLRTHFDRIGAVIDHDELADIAPRLATLANDADPWLAQAGAAFVRGSPTSAALAFALQRRAKHLSLADVFRLEYQASLGCCAHADFAEGIRALLVDKDRRPRWQPATLAEVSAEHIDAHLAPRFDGLHPLTDLH